MSCYSPMSVPRPKGFGPADRIIIPCGRCLECLKRNQAAWAFRLTMELRSAVTAYFVTLTYNDENLPVNDADNNEGFSLSKSDLSLFWKRLRRDLNRLYKGIDTPEKVREIKYRGISICPQKPLRYYAVGEYGTKYGRPHYHALIFNLPIISGHDKLIIQSVLQKAWQKGNVHIGTVTSRSINYVSGYIIGKNSYIGKGDKPFSVMSQGIGRDYIEKHGHFHAINGRFFVTDMSDNRLPLPRYYRTKIFTEAEREEANLQNQNIAFRRMLREEAEIKSKGYEIHEYKDQVRNDAIMRINEHNKKRKYE